MLLHTPTLFSKTVTKLLAKTEVVWILQVEDGLPLPKPLGSPYMWGLNQNYPLLCRQLVTIAKIPFTLLKRKNLLLGSVPKY
ncbi:MAG: hypothetical protein AN484_28195 [Aphanizomenon flos-aquae WA102]|uniref:Uncharacterized protein n=1 Tax=Aphanizomenon flos-aquae WA102 TaxID=1710896 RepID=A0A1B7W4X9_APHFL|nr:MAG: hypothetical protein AN484_28195 [Aphanizomenon flos-aquae WA102]